METGKIDGSRVRYLRVDQERVSILSQHVRLRSLKTLGGDETNMKGERVHMRSLGLESLYQKVLRLVMSNYNCFVYHCVS